ncbi:MAG: homoserine kinase [Armatimonadota bacterium]|nr:homoserine kinase [Armatimonadota bacterium]MDR7468996.1 homoserine kinase [Armatimonadota bacterium]MDR7538037.1 homoserine kinase [Armatimonadota bacterium]
MTVEVAVPATIANLGPGFDALGMAVNLYDRFRVSIADRPAVSFSGGDAAALAGEPAPLVLRAAEEVARQAGRRAAFAIEARLAVPVTRGLGSSAAAIVGGAVAANELLGHPLDQTALLELAVQLEGHPDNVAAALLGGVVVVTRDGQALRAGRFLPRLDLEIALAIPDRVIPTAEARALLPRTVPLADAVFNLSRVALLVAALLTGDGALLPAALQDRLHQPHRARLLPGFAAVLVAAREAGAYGAVLAGSGSTVAAFSPPGRGERVGEAMRQAFASHGVTSATRTVSVDAHGATVYPS